MRLFSGVYITVTGEHNRRIVDPLGRLTSTPKGYNLGIGNPIGVSEEGKNMAEKNAQSSACPHCGTLKHTPRSPELKADVARRINRAVGQLNGIKAMVEADRYCGDVLTQLAAVVSAVKAISREVMQDHLETCVVERIQSGDTEVVGEVMGLFKKFM